MLARLSAFQGGVGTRSYSASTHADPRAKLRRSLLYVPSSNDRMLQKSLSSPSDALIYDLEDSVAPNEKERARTALLGFLQSQPREHASRTFVRLNAIDTPQFVGDITTVLKWEHLEGIVMPKIHSASYLDKVASYVPEGRPLSIIASIESARGLWDAGHIAGWKAGQGAGNKVTVSSLLMATAAKAFGIQCIDMVCVNYKDTSVLRDECEEARRLGYDGKQAIHPNQVEIIQSTFVPTEKGAFGLDSGSGEVEMIDAPMLKQAEATIAKAKAAGLKIPDV
ncbi:citrate lyase subunit beta-like protein [Rhizoctonia solani]|uniref:Citrate lyase subunit beta-like protein n=1 Tax=Rhizoctonia solani TaxID=456999 RepID=A0A8H8NRZ8_9AGAM|nr:citrate lyase subunit beta-like protein [Rhizoctonia solani]QRW18829.1 citrate lyase subunit beta-like protein [Rhizoctonia solani]